MAVLFEGFLKYNIKVLLILLKQGSGHHFNIIYNKFNFFYYNKNIGVYSIFYYNNA